MNTSNIFGFEETEKMGLRKGIVYYFNDWIDEKIISILEEIVEQFLSLTQAQFTKKRSGENDAYVNRRNIRGGWKKVFHRAFDNFDDSNILILDNCCLFYTSDAADEPTRGCLRVPLGVSRVYLHMVLWLC